MTQWLFRIPYLALAKSLEEIEESSSGKLDNVSIICDFFVSAIKLSPSDLPASVYCELSSLLQ